MKHLQFRKLRNAQLGARVVKALESRNMEAYYVATKEEALAKALELIPQESSISWGGTMSAIEIGLLSVLREGNYEVYDRADAKTEEEHRAIMLKAFDVDYYIGSVNGMSEDGVLINVDGQSNRVAAYAYGPRHVLLIVGMNKVCKTLDDAMSRARNEASPINSQRFGIEPPCVKTGSCSDCKHVHCICCNIVVTRFQRTKDRMKVILVDDVLGF